MTNRRPLALLLIAALLPLVVLSAVLGVVALRQQRRAMEREALDQVTRISALVGRELTAQLDVLQAFAQSPLIEGVRGEVAFTEGTERLLRQHPLWRTVSLSDRYGNRLFDVPEIILALRAARSSRRTVTNDQTARGKHRRPVRAGWPGGATIVGDPRALRWRGAL